jgi:hypothetical protein
MMLVVHPGETKASILGSAVIRQSNLTNELRVFSLTRGKAIIRPPEAVFQFDMQTFQLLSAVKSSKYVGP